MQTIFEVRPVKKYFSQVDKIQFLFRLHMYKSRMAPDSFYYQEIHSRSATITGRNLHIYRIENLGNCCWEIYSGTHFSGPKETLNQNFDKAPKLETIRTARVVDC